MAVRDYNIRLYRIIFQAGNIRTKLDSHSLKPNPEREFPFQDAYSLNAAGALSARTHVQSYVLNAMTTIDRSTN